MKNKEILITGGTGSIGKALVKKLLSEYSDIKGIRIYSRDEVKQNEFRQELGQKFPKAKTAFLLGDVRDKDRLNLACQGVHIIIHTAAMKQVPACEYNPIEAVKTNINGAKNVIYAAINNKIEKVMNISTDKAVYPINLYGCTKAVAEKLFLHANVYSKIKYEKKIATQNIFYIAHRYPKFSVCRYGNVAGSRGSIIPLWKSQIDTKQQITITSDSMTRFWISINEACTFILKCIKNMNGSELFIPEMRSFQIIDLVKVINKSNNKINVIGKRSGEKFHESIITNEEQEQKHVYLYTFKDKQFTNNLSLMEKTSEAFIKDYLTPLELQEKLDEI